MPCSRLSTVRLHQVDLQGEGVFAKFGDQFVELFAFAVDQYHFCASSQQGPRALEADTGRRAGDRGDFTAEEVFIEETECFIL